MTEERNNLTIGCFYLNYYYRKFLTLIKNLGSEAIRFLHFFLFGFGAASLRIFRQGTGSF